MLPSWKVDFLFLLLRLNIALRKSLRALTNSAASGVIAVCGGKGIILPHKSTSEENKHEI